MKVNNKVLPNTDITLKEFKELLFKQFLAYPMMKTNYKNNTFIVTSTYYSDNINITVNKLCLACDKLGVKYKVNCDSIEIELLAK